MKSSNLLLACSNSSLRGNIINVLEPEYGSGALDVQDPAEWDEIIGRLRQDQPEILMLELGPVLSRLGDALREVRSCNPRTKVVALHPTTDSESILTALRSGVNEFVHPPWDETLRPALERVFSMPSESNRLSLGQGWLRRNHHCLPCCFRSAPSDQEESPAG